MMPSALLRKIEQFSPLGAEDRQAIEAICGERVRQFGPREDIIREGDRQDQLYVFLSGWACRYKQLEDGRRQILAFLLPGDTCDRNAFLLRETDHSVGALTPVTLAEVSSDAMAAVEARHPRIERALNWETLVAIATQREWTVSLGQRSALERMAHLLCELFFRLRAVGLTEGDSCAFPITQVELGYATGLSNVHVNRTLQELRAAGLVVLRDRTLTLPRLPALMRAGLFNPTYLHLDREGRELDTAET
jgi:CRP-like cAMP-binding protein